MQMSLLAETLYLKMLPFVGSGLDQALDLSSIPITIVPPFVLLSSLFPTDRQTMRLNVSVYGAGHVVTGCGEE